MHYFGYVWLRFTYLLTYLLLGCVITTGKVFDLQTVQRLGRVGPVVGSRGQTSPGRVGSQVKRLDPVPSLALHFFRASHISLVLVGKWGFKELLRAVWLFKDCLR